MEPASKKMRTITLQRAPGGDVLATPIERQETERITVSNLLVGDIGQTSVGMFQCSG
jgi:hypothetical protein